MLHETASKHANRAAVNRLASTSTARMLLQWGRRNRNAATISAWIRCGKDLDGGALSTTTIGNHNVQQDGGSPINYVPIGSRRQNSQGAKSKFVGDEDGIG
jgi:hypothetical protein